MSISAAATPGRFGLFGGRYVSETLIPSLDELEAAWAAASADPAFNEELNRLLSRLRRPADAAGVRGAALGARSRAKPAATSAST